MKFAKHLEAESVSEWRKCYINYKGLKKKLKAIQKYRRANDRAVHSQIENALNNHSTQRLDNNNDNVNRDDQPVTSTVSGSTRRPHTNQHDLNWRPKRNYTAPTDLDDFRLDRQGSFAKSILSRISSTFLREETELDHFPPNARSYSLEQTALDEILSHSSEPERYFFNMLDQELEKISRFYDQKEKEAKAKFEALKMQLGLVRQYRNQLNEMHNHEDDTLEQRLNPMHWFHHYQKPTKPNLENGSSPNSKIIPQGDPNMSYRVARGRLKAAIIEFYRSLELLRSFKILNETGFQKILKKFDKTAGWKASNIYITKLKTYHWFTSDSLNDMIASTERVYIREFANGHRRKGMKKLRVPEPDGNFNSNTWRIGFCFGACVAIFSRVIQLATDPYGRIILSGLVHVEFRDFFIADELNSLAFSMWMTAYFFCVYGWGWSDLDIHCNVPKMWVTPLIACLPPWWRFIQCIRRYYDSRERHHLVNGLKYVTSILATILSGIRRISSSPSVEVMWILASIINSCYTSIWDIKMDWGLLDVSSYHFLLRDELVFYKWTYYVAMPLDILLRFSWAVNKAGLVYSSQIITFATALAECFRRIVWNFFRLENEHLNNCGNYRAIKEIPLPFAMTEIYKSSEDEEEVGSIRLPLDQEDLANTAITHIPPTMVSDIPVAPSPDTIHSTTSSLHKPSLTNMGSFYGRRDFETRQDRSDDKQLPMSLRKPSMVEKVLDRLRVIGAPADTDSENDDDDDDEDDGVDSD
ncbi:EXS family-domain-containing protein [Cunninghamella echinulata]|nr:EXS family-domain-containing protein [Cunninghamella echinulata]